LQATDKLLLIVNWFTIRTLERHEHRGVAKLVGRWRETHAVGSQVAVKTISKQRETQHCGEETGWH